MSYRPRGEENPEGANWNSAAMYSELVVMRYIRQANMYDEIATFGTSNIIEDFTIDDNSKNFARIQAVKRLWKALEMLINASRMALIEADKKKVDILMTKLVSIKPYIAKIEEIKRDERNGTTRIDINPQIFESVHTILIQIKVDLLEPINSNNLIYGKFTEYDPDKVKEEFMREMIETP